MIFTCLISSELDSFRAIQTTGEQLCVAVKRRGSNYKVWTGGQREINRARVAVNEGRLPQNNLWTETSALTKTEIRPTLLNTNHSSTVRDYIYHIKLLHFLLSYDRELACLISFCQIGTKAHGKKLKLVNFKTNPTWLFKRNYG